MDVPVDLPLLLPELVAKVAGKFTSGLQRNCRMTDKSVVMGLQELELLAVVVAVLSL